MSKLYFRYGTVGSAKTLNLLSVAHTYRKQGKVCELIKPAIDTRFGKDVIRSRAGLEIKADYVVEDTDRIWLKWTERRGGGHTLDVDCVLVDEAQFLTVLQIEQLREITILWGIPVICYGLRTDFRGNLFPASKRLFELADKIEEIKNVCHYCSNKSIMNLKHVDGRATKEGPVVELGAEEKYFPVCYDCYVQELENAVIQHEKELDNE